MTLANAVYIALSKDHDIEYIKSNDTYRHNCYPDCNDCFFRNKQGGCDELDDSIPKEHIVHIEKYHPEALI